MIIRSKRALLSSLTCFGLAFAPSAFAADILEIQDFVGVINWSNGPMAIDVKENQGELKISEGRRVIIDGGIEALNGSDCESSYGLYDLDWFGKKKKGHFGGYDDLGLSRSQCYLACQHGFSYSQFHCFHSGGASCQPRRYRTLALWIPQTRRYRK